MTGIPLAELVSGVELLCLDAGNTIVFFDHERLARLLGARGFATTAEALLAGEGSAKHLHEEDRMLDPSWSFAHLPGARGWGSFIGTLLVSAGFPEGDLPDALGALWREHDALNLWSSVPAGMGDALDAARATGARVVVVSNSEGKVAHLLERLGIAGHFDAVVDSGLLGIEKPDPRIFTRAMDLGRAGPSGTLHIGDTFATDTVGARAANVRTALIDPFALYRGRHPDVPRVASVAEVAYAIADSRRRARA